MSRHWTYEHVGELALNGQEVDLVPPGSQDPQGIVAFVERGASCDGRLASGAGAIRYVKYGWLRSVVARPHPMARQALLEGANVDVYIHAWDDPLAATATALTLLEHDRPPWNLGIRK